MADKAITALTEDVSPTANDVMPLVDLETGTTKKVTLGKLAAALASIFPEGTFAGTLGVARRTTSFTTTSVGTDVTVTDLSVTVNVPTTMRRLRVRVYGRDVYKSSTGSGLWSIKEGATTLQIGLVNLGPNLATPLNLEYIEDAPAAGTRTFHLAVSQSTAGTLGLEAFSSAPASISVELA